MEAEKRSQPPWSAPPSTAAELHLHNSLTRKKEKFVPRKENQVLWYICGPTVYDSAHMGHARSYVSFDILRRVLRDYFGYAVRYAMNVTDVDDKIIRRARQAHLLDQYLAAHPPLAGLIADCTAAHEHMVEKIKTVDDIDKKAMLLGQADAMHEKLAQLVSLAAGGDERSKMLAVQELLASGARDALADWLDSRKGHLVTDHSIFAKLSRKFEAEYHEDMAMLNVLEPDVLTRVSEYVPEIVHYIETIISRGYAYEANGSVYFDTERFSQRHFYAKLVPEACADPSSSSSAIAEGEGELSSKTAESEKRNLFDFALWKASKPGEPEWDSPWGRGRPGWHIECSLMASAVCGDKLDIHSGGFDLKFPHHDNEIAQAEAHQDSDTWVNYWLHAGTLRIRGLKMSKSLKNFITIRACLERYSAAQLRMLFLLHHWTDVLDYSESTMERALVYEKTFNEFRLLADDLLRKVGGPSSWLKPGPEDLRIADALSTAQAAIHTSLCDSVDTKGALEALKELVSETNVYVLKAEAERRPPYPPVLRDVRDLVARMLGMFGVTSAGRDEAAGTREQHVLPYLDVLSDFRERVRQAGLEAKCEAVLRECDRLRDEALPAVGVRLEDRDGRTCLKLVDPATLAREREQQEQLRVAKEAEKLKKKAEAEAREASKRIPPSEMFRTQTDKFSAFDARGVPTHDVQGEPLSKKQLKKLEKLYETQQAKHASVMNGDA